MTRGRLGWLLAVALALSCLAGPARAEPRAQELEYARRLFDEATALERQSAWREASEKLDAALAIKETPGLHFHRAHCAEQLGELVLAARHYGRSEAMIRAGAAAPDVEELLVAARARVLARVPRLTLSLPSDVRGATLEIDGTPVSDESGTPVLLDPGRHRIVARAPGRRDFEMEITLAEGQTQTLEVLLSEPPATASPGARPKETKTERETSGIGAREVVLIGEATLAVAGLATGIGFSIAKESASDRAAQARQAVDPTNPNGASDCPDANPVACAELEDANADGKQASRFATVGFVTAGVGAVATILTWVLWPSDPPVAASMEPSAEGAKLTLFGRF
jgi:hypothetical protein